MTVETPVLRGSDYRHYETWVKREDPGHVHQPISLLYCGVNSNVKENVCWHQQQLCDPDTMVSALQTEAGMTRKAQGTEGAAAIKGIERFHCQGTINKHGSLTKTYLSRILQEMARSQSPSGSIFGIRCLLHLREHIIPLGEVGVNLIKPSRALIYRWSGLWVGPHPHPEINPVIFHMQLSGVRGWNKINR